MNELRKKFTHVEQRNFEEALIIKCEQIADDYALKFFAWASEHSLNVGEELYKITDNFIEKREVFTQEELLQYFKDNVYGKE